MISLGQSPSDAVLDKMIRSVDRNNNGLIDFPEFLVLMEHKLKDTADDEMMIAFKQFDLDGDGLISPEELQTTMSKLQGSPMSDEQVEHIMLEVDRDGDGMINYDEFVRMMFRK